MWPMGILITVQRDDSVGHGARLRRALEERLGADRVADACARPQAVLVVIGPCWSATRAEDEGIIGPALAGGVPVIPVIVEGASMPEAEALPPDLVSLSRLTPTVLPDARWTAGVNRLAAVLERIAPPGEGGTPRRARRRRGLSRRAAIAIILAIVALGTAAGVVSAVTDSEKPRDPACDASFRGC
jgi:hypothetical protein